MTGKVVATSPRPARAPARTAPAIAATRGGGSPRSGSRGALRLPSNRVMLYSVLLLVGGVLLFVLGAHATSSPALKSETIFTAGDALAATDGYAILVATFHGSETDHLAAWAARNELQKQGYEAKLLGYPGKDADSYDRYELLVGHAETGAQLESVLGKLRSLKKWPGIEGAPFSAARIVPVPKTAG